MRLFDVFGAWRGVTSEQQRESETEAPTDTCGCCGAEHPRWRVSIMPRSVVADRRDRLEATPLALRHRPAAARRCTPTITRARRRDRAHIAPHFASLAAPLPPVASRCRRRRTTRPLRRGPHRRTSRMTQQEPMYLTIKRARRDPPRRPQDHPKRHQGWPHRGRARRKGVSHSDVGDRGSRSSVARKDRQLSMSIARCSGALSSRRPVLLTPRQGASLLLRSVL